MANVNSNRSHWPAVGADLPADLVKAALSISGLFDLAPVSRTPFLKADLRLTPAAVRKLSPAYFPPPAVPVLATVGAQESEEFLRQNMLLRQVWGERAVPVCEAIEGTHHLNVVDSLAQPGGRLHALALVNPAIRAEEIAFFEQQLAAGDAAIARAELELQALRLVINT